MSQNSHIAKRAAHRALMSAIVLTTALACSLPLAASAATAKPPKSTTTSLTIQKTSPTNNVTKGVTRTPHDSTTPPIAEAITGWDENGIWEGNFRLDAGTFPVYAITAFAWFPQGTYAAPKPVPQSTTATKLAYLLSTYQTSPNPETQAALAAIVGLKYDTVDKQEKWSALSTSQQDLANTLLAEANTQLGPYSYTISLPHPLLQSGTYQATVTMRSTTGAPVPNHTVDLAATNATLTPTTGITNASGQITTTVHVSQATPATESPTLTLTATSTTAKGLQTYAPTGANAARRETVLGLASPTIDTTHKTFSYTPTRQTTIAVEPAANQAPLAGATFELFDAANHLLGSFTSTTSPTDLGALPINATYTIKETALPPGHYAQTTSYTFTPNLASHTLTIALLNPQTPTPSITATTPSPHIHLQEHPKDTVTLSGNDGETGLLVTVAKGPLTASACATTNPSDYAALPVAATASTHIKANTDYTVSLPTLPLPGCYLYVNTLTLSPSSATASYESATNNVTDAAEPLAALTASTTALKTGTTLSGKLSLTGLGTESANATIALLGPLTPHAGSCTGLDWTSASTIATYKKTATADGILSTPAAQISTKGCYTYKAAVTYSDTTTTTLAAGASKNTALATTPPTPTTTTPTTTTPTTTPPTTTPKPSPATKTAAIPAGLGAGPRHSISWLLLVGILLVLIATTTLFIAYKRRNKLSR